MNPATLTFEELAEPTAVPMGEGERAGEGREGGRTWGMASGTSIDSGALGVCARKNTMFGSFRRDSVKASSRSVCGQQGQRVEQ